MRARAQLKFLSGLALVASLATANPVLARQDIAAEVQRSAPDKLLVKWSPAVPVDVFASTTPDAALSDGTLVSRGDRDGRHEVTVKPGERLYFTLRDRGDSHITRTAERVVPLTGGSNFRDLGGYRTTDGRHVRWGMIYRSASTAMLTPEDLQAVKGLGLRDMVDFRSNEERALAPTRIDGVRYTAVGYSMLPMVQEAAKHAKAGQSQTIETMFPLMYSDLPVSITPQLRALFDRLAHPDGPLEFNCSAGQDRTGLAAALILEALGVPRETIYADYLLSMTYRRAELIMPPLDPAEIARNPVAAMFANAQKPQGVLPPLHDSAGKPYLAFAFEAIESRWGSTRAYLANELGFDDAKIAALRAAYLE